MSDVLQKDITGNNLIKRPAKSWIHPDSAMQDGVIYNVKYVGCIGVTESMKSLSFETRTQVARESIRRVAERAKLLNAPRRNRKNDEQLTRILSNNINTQWSGMDIELHVNTQSLKITQVESPEVLFQHTMQNISFACGGDAEIQDFVAYVAKDDSNGRACYVFECNNGLANNVITTIGQAFELRFKKFLNSIPAVKNDQDTNSSPGVLKEQKFNVSGSTQSHSNHTNGGTNTGPQSSANHKPQSNGNGHIEVPLKKFNPAEHIGASGNHNNHHLGHHHVNSSSQETPKLTPFQPSGTTPSKSSTTTASSSSASGHVRVDEKLEKMPWFHGLLTRENAEKLLVKDGDYLVRETNKANRQYVLSGRYKGECRHIFLVDPSGIVRTKDRVFDNICHLIKYHQENNIPIISKDNELLLENPVCK